MKISFVRREDWEQDYIQKALGAEHQLKFVQDLTELSSDDKQDTDILSLFIKTPVSAELLEEFPKLKLIAVRATGFDHIDIESCQNRDIKVATVPNYGQETVAEYTLALILNLSRRVTTAYQKVVETGTFNQVGLQGFDLQGKTLGVIGTGRIGLNVIKMAQGFEMSILAYDPFPKTDATKNLDFTYTDFDSLLAQSDILTLHVPHNEHTHHLINQNNIDLIKPGAYLINTARGGLIETQAIIHALKKEILAGAALDVLEEEGVIGDEMALLENPHPQPEALKTLLSNHYLIDHPQVLITPHNAFNTRGALKRILDTTISNITSFHQDQPINLVC